MSKRLGQWGSGAGVSPAIAAKPQTWLFRLMYRAGIAQAFGLMAGGTPAPLD